jgi:hypothetical protein
VVPRVTEALSEAYVFGTSLLTVARNGGWGWGWGQKACHRVTPNIEKYSMTPPFPVAFRP